MESIAADPAARAVECPLRLPNGLCTFLTFVFGAIAVTSGLAAVFDQEIVRYLQEVRAGVPVDAARGQALDDRQALMGAIQVVAQLVCGVAFLFWFHRAHANLRAAGLKTRYGSGWAVGGFFVPFLNLVRPYQVMREVWAGSAILAGRAPAASLRVDQVRTSPLVGWWWTLFAISTGLSGAAGRLLAHASDLDDSIRAMWTWCVADGADVPAALVALALVRGVTAMQQSAAEDYPQVAERLAELR